MRSSLWGSLRSLAITLLILIVFEILGSTLFPLFGLHQYRLSFNILIVLFMGFKLGTPYTAFFIFAIQYFHGFFSIEGWEMGTIAGVLITILISYLKDLLHFSSSAATIMVTQLFQFIWFGIVSFLIYLKTENVAYILNKFWRFLPESILISLMAPVVFFILEQIWSVDDRGSLGEQG